MNALDVVLMECGLVAPSAVGDGGHRDDVGPDHEIDEAVGRKTLGRFGFLRLECVCVCVCVCVRMYIN